MEEADALMCRAAKHIKTSMFKWTSNWEAAAKDYESAGMLYSRVGDTKNVRIAWEEAATAHQKNGQTFLAARVLDRLGEFLAEQARSATLNRELYLKLLDDSVETLRAAANKFAEDSKFDKRAEELVKAANLLHPVGIAGDSQSSMALLPQEEQEKFKRAVNLMKEAVEVLEENEECSLSYIVRLPEIYRTWLLMHLRAGDILGAVGVLERQLGVRLASASATCGGNGSSEAKNKGLFHRLNQPHNVAKAGLEVVVLCLSQNDIPLARNAMTRLHNLQGFVGSGEETLAASLLSAFEDRDAGRIQEALSDNKLLFITSDISRIARNMKLKFATISTSKQSEQQNEEDEDFESLR